MMFCRVSLANSSGKAVSGIKASLKYALIASGLLLLSQSKAFAESIEYTTFSTPRFTLHFDKTRGKGAVSPQTPRPSAEQIAEHALEILNRTHDDLEQIFKSAPEKKVVLKFLTPPEFRRQTGAPEWTSAMFFRDEITVPLNDAKPLDLDELGRALRHEYVHAFVAEISKYRCPAWLDEGIAQLIEGEPNPLLGPALRRWTVHNDPIPLSWLQNGFTTLDETLVPTAYAQSLFASRMLVQDSGFEGITNYLVLLGQGMDENMAFHRAFKISKRSFEAGLKVATRKWAVSAEIHP